MIDRHPAVVATRRVAVELPLSCHRDPSWRRAATVPTTFRLVTYRSLVNYRVRLNRDQAGERIPQIHTERRKTRRRLRARVGASVFVGWHVSVRVERVPKAHEDSACCQLPNRHEEDDSFHPSCRFATRTVAAIV
ncbi:MAG: hypothetical protein DWQ31_12395 [Planctomycetota bacterium]|nr:MAG: hypothetical protein DWQ31_12395 [Planctomycetota bacterium]REJ89862.1 MAG: hypothetical protein DWQ35_17600 [Planctomycetota bacterium]REK25439.1 MAG: hypothetical protein DWQ42_11020 [Planctomycetota bacterium]